MKMILKKIDGGVGDAYLRLIGSLLVDQQSVAVKNRFSLAPQFGIFVRRSVVCSSSLCHLLPEKKL
jgi:hypothetical protein